VSPLAIAAVVAAAVLVLLLPRLLVRRAQDRLAGKRLGEDGERFKLLTRADLVSGTYRRSSGVLGLTEDAVAFEGLFGEAAVVPTSRIQKIVTGKKLANGRQLLRLEVLRLTRSTGEELEFVLSPASAAAWRSHLGLWAVQERKASMDTVRPGRK
jgi:hypothetical protein